MSRSWRGRHLARRSPSSPLDRRRPERPPPARILTIKGNGELFERLVTLAGHFRDLGKKLDVGSVTENGKCIDSGKTNGLVAIADSFRDIRSGSLIASPLEGA